MEDKRAMIIAPHPDDEINLAGQILPYLHDNDYKIYVVYTTNGDSEVKIGNKRLVEAIESCEVLGIPRENVLFLGYANEWEKGIHIYNANENEILSSLIGKNETNSINNHPEYCFKKSKVHHSFTRKNFKADLKQCISDILPEIIICVDFDSHPDHRGTSLLFEEIMGEILKENYKYRPLVLKRFAYNGVWKGEKDFYSNPLEHTILKTGFKYGGVKHELEAPCYSVQDAFTVMPSPSRLSWCLSNSKIYKASVKHKSTVAWYEMQRVLNGDLKYWIRETNNLLFSNVSITASSGLVSYINDFKTYDTGDVLSSDMSSVFKEYCWRPDQCDVDKELRIVFDKEKRIKQINIYEDFRLGHHISSLEIRIGERAIMVEPNAVGLKSSIFLEDEVTAKSIVIKVISGEGEFGIAEIEVLSNGERQYDTISVFNTKIKPLERDGLKILALSERIWFLLKFIFTFKLQYEAKRLRRKL